MLRRKRRGRSFVQAQRIGRVAHGRNTFRKETPTGSAPRAFSRLLVRASLANTALASAGFGKVLLHRASRCPLDSRKEFSLDTAAARSASVNWRGGWGWLASGRGSGGDCDGGITGFARRSQRSRGVFIIHAKAFASARGRMKPFLRPAHRRWSGASSRRSGANLRLPGTARKPIRAKSGRRAASTHRVFPASGWLQEWPASRQVFDWRILSGLCVSSWWCLLQTVSGEDRALWGHNLSARAGLRGPQRLAPSGSPPGGVSFSR